MKSYNFHLISLLVLVVFFPVLCPQKTHAALTKQLSYQGRLNNASGQPVANGTYSIVFSIYNVSTGGSALWTETQNVSVESGGFSAYLGSVNPLTLPFNEDYYLGIKVGSDPEMTPRLKLAIVGTSAFAFEAGKLEGKAASDFALSTHNHDSNYSASAHTHPATGVTQIVAGANVTISPSGGTGVVTINAAGGGGGSSLTPASTVQPVTSASIVGTSLNYAREDHAHNIPAGLITNAEINASAAITKSKLNLSNSILFSDIAQNGCASGQVVEWNGTAWNCGTDDVGGGGGIVTNPSSIQTIQGTTAGVTPLALQGQSAQSAALFDVKDFSGGSLVKVSPSGNLLVGNPTTTTAKVSAEETGTTNAGGAFVISNASNMSVAVYGETYGSGDGVLGVTNGTGKAIHGVVYGTSGQGGLFEIQNATNAQAAVYGITGGTGPAGNFELNNASNSQPALRVSTGGIGSAGVFLIGNASNSASLIFGNNSLGTGNLLQLQQGAVNKFVVDNAGNITVGGAANTVKNNPSANQTIQPTADVVPLIIKDDAAATADLLDIQNNASASLMKVASSGNLLVGSPAVASAKVSAYDTGTANHAGYFQISNASSAKNAVYGTTNGTGNAGIFEIGNATNSNPALYVTTNGSGSSASFNSTTGANGAPLIIGNHSGIGNLLELQQGGTIKFVVGNTGDVVMSKAGTSLLDVKDAANTTLNITNSLAGTASLQVEGATVLTSASGAVVIGPGVAQTDADPDPSIWINDTTGGNLLQLQQGAADKFVVTNAGNVLVGNPATTTPKLSVLETGANKAGYFFINNGANTEDAVYVETNGTGRAGVFYNLSATNANPALEGVTAGTGNAGYFWVNNGSNSASTIKGNTTGTGNLLQLQQTGVNKFVVENSGNTLIGNPALTTAKVSAQESGATNNAGIFIASNAANADAALYAETYGTGPAINGKTSGTGWAGFFEVANASNSTQVLTSKTNGLGATLNLEINNAINGNQLIFGNIVSGTGELLKLQQGSVDKFVVSNAGSILLDGNANPSIKASGATPNLILDADGTGASIVTVKNTTSPGNVMLQVNGNITAFSGSNSVPVTGATQQLIQYGNTCEAVATAGNITVTFPTPFSATPTVTATHGVDPSGLPLAAILITAKSTTSFSITGFDNSVTYTDCIDWIAIGNK